MRGNTQLVVILEESLRPGETHMAVRNNPFSPPLHDTSALQAGLRVRECRLHAKRWLESTIA